MEKLISFLDSSFFQTLAVFLGGIIAWWVFWRQGVNKRRDAARIVCMEIETITNAANEIKLFANRQNGVNENAVFTSAPLYQNVSWYDNRNLFVRKLSNDCLERLNQFYSKAVKLEEARKSLQEFILSGRAAKAAEFQAHTVRICAMHAGNGAYLACPKEKRSEMLSEDVGYFKQACDGVGAEFFSKAVFERLINAAEDFHPIDVYPLERLRKIAGYKKH